MVWSSSRASRRDIRAGGREREGAETLLLARGRTFEGATRAHQGEKGNSGDRKPEGGLNDDDGGQAAMKISKIEIILLLAAAFCFALLILAPELIPQSPVPNLELIEWSNLLTGLTIGFLSSAFIVIFGRDREPKEKELPPP